MTMLILMYKNRLKIIFLYPIKYSVRIFYIVKRHISFLF